MPWNGEAILAYLACDKRQSVPEWHRCVNEGAEGCTVRAEDNGWCKPCAAGLFPATAG